MKLVILVTLVIQVGITWWRIRARAGRTLKLLALAYLGVVGARLAQSGIDQEQWTLAGFSFAFFAGLWGLAWLITRSVEKRRRY